MPGMKSDECIVCNDYKRFAKNLIILNETKLTQYNNSCHTCTEMCRDKERLLEPSLKKELKKECDDYEKYSKISTKSLQRLKDKNQKDNLEKLTNFWRASSKIHDPFPPVPTHTIK